MKIGFKEGFKVTMGAFAADFLITVGFLLSAFLVLLLIGLLSGCGSKAVDGVPGPAGASCKSSEYPANENYPNGGVVLECPGSPILIVENGNRGIPGVPGYNALLAAAGGAPGCSNGGRTVLVGTDLNRDGTLEPEEVGHSFEVCNGANGTSSPVAISELVDPCGDAAGIHDEVLLRLANGQLLASFSDNANGLNTRFSLIGPGSYQTTDGSGCNFTINADGSIQ